MKKTYSAGAIKSPAARNLIRAYQQHHEQAMANIAAFEGRQIEQIANGDSLKPGEIYLANESVFTQQYFDEPLTAYAVGWRDRENIQATLDFFAPAVPVPRRFTYKEWTNIEEFLSDGANDDLRAIGAEFPTVKYTGKETHARTDNRGLRIRIDLDEVADPNSALAGGLPAYQARAVERLKRRILRNSLRRVISLLSNAATNTAKTWDTTAGKDPDQDVLSELVTATDTSGIRPNKIGYGDTAWTKRVLAHRAQNIAGGYSSAGLNPAELGAFLGADILVSRERYSAAGASLAQVVSNLVLMFFTMGIDLEDPSNIKRFISMADGGGEWRVYVQQVTSKLVDITVEHYELAKITSTLGIRKFTVS